MKNFYKSICVVDTVYSLMLYLLLGKYDISETYFYFSSGVPKEIRERFCHTYLLQTSKDNFLLRSYIAVRNFCVFNFSFKSKRLQGLDVYGHDHLIFSRYFLDKEDSDIFVIEDGYANYNSSNYSLEVNNDFLSSLKRKIFGIKQYPKFGLSPRVKKVFLTGSKPIPEIIKNKVIVNKPESLWKKLSDARRNEILKIFGVPDPSSFKGRRYLLITQCFSEYSEDISETQKINFYKGIVKGVNENELIIKPHPRGITDYKEFFPDALVLNKAFPLELLFLSCVDISITDVFSVDSSCLTMISDRDIMVHTYDRSMLYENN